MAKYKHRRLFTLNNPYAPRLCPELAKEIGLEESVLLLQLEFWIATEGQERDDGLWVRKPVREIQETLTFWHISTIARALKSLVTSGYLTEGDFDEGPGKGARWVRLNLTKIDTLRSVRLSQDETTVVAGNDDSVAESDNRPYREDKEHIQASVRQFDPERSARLAARPRRETNGRRKPPAPELLPLPDGFRPLATALAQVEKVCPDIDIESTLLTWKCKQISTAAVSADWNASFIGYAATCQSNITGRRKEREQRYG